MAAITATDVRDASPQNTRVKSYRAGEALTKGQVVCFDKGNTNNRIWSIEFTDYDRLDYIGVVLESVAAGEHARVALPGSILTGYALDPGSTAIHQPGNLVYTADEGAVSDSAGATTLNARAFGAIVAISDTAYGILLLEPGGRTYFSTIKHNLIATTAPGVTNDVDEGYVVGSLWVDVTGGDVYMCIDNSDGAAVWLELGATP